MLKNQAKMIKTSIAIPILTLLLFVTSLTSCSKKKPGLIPSVCTSISSPCLNGKAIVQMETNKGTITLEINGEASPVTAGNFVDLVRRKAYRQVLFHRVIKEPVPFVAQTGDPLSSNPANPSSTYGTGNFIDPSTDKARFIPLEMKLKTEDVPRYNQLITNPNQINQLELIHNIGALGMARSQRLNSASSQFYIALKALPELNGRYSVFGKVIKGFDILKIIEQGDLIFEMKLLSPKMP